MIMIMIMIIMIIIMIIIITIMIIIMKKKKKRIVKIYIMLPTEKYELKLTIWTRLFNRPITLSMDESLSSRYVQAREANRVIPWIEICPVNSIIRLIKQYRGLKVPHNMIKSGKYRGTRDLNWCSVNSCMVNPKVVV